MEAIVWSDDLAIPWLTTQADQLPGAIEHLRQQIHKVFQRRGFELNMQKGKTTAVATFRGPGAPALRRQYQLIAASGIMCNVAPGKDEWLTLCLLTSTWEPTLRLMEGTRLKSKIALARP